MNLILKGFIVCKVAFHSFDQLLCNHWKQEIQTKTVHKIRFFHRQLIYINKIKNFFNFKVEDSFLLPLDFHHKTCFSGFLISTQQPGSSH